MESSNKTGGQLSRERLTQTTVTSDSSPNYAQELLDSISLNNLQQDSTLFKPNPNFSPAPNNQGGIFTQDQEFLTLETWKILIGKIRSVENGNGTNQ